MKIILTFLFIGIIYTIYIAAVVTNVLAVMALVGALVLLMVIIYLLDLVAKYQEIVYTKENQEAESVEEEELG